MRLLAIVVVCSVLVTPAFAGARKDCSGPICVHASHGPKGLVLVADNSGKTDVWVELRLTQTQNLFAVAEPQRKRIPAGKSVVMIRAAAREEGRPFDYRYRWEWSVGNPGAQHDDDYLYAIPIGGARRMEAVAQLNTQPRGVRAAFFPHEGDEVIAARDGTVATVRSTEAGGTSVRVLHQDGTFGDYVFTGSAATAESANVRRGEAIGRIVGNGSLFFAVRKSAGRRSAPVPFLIEDGTPQGCLAGN